MSFSRPEIYHTNQHISDLLHDTDFLSIHNAHIDKSSLNLQINFAITTSSSQLRPVNQRFLDPRIPEICGLRGLKPESTSFCRHIQDFEHKRFPVKKITVKPH